MLFYTHLMFSVLIGLYLSEYFPYNKIVFVVLAALFGVFLDIDRVNSKIGKKVKIISVPLNFILGHRKLIHSLLFIVFGFVVFNLFNGMLAYAFLIGTLSHLFLDMLTKEGIMLFYPVKWKIRGFIKTGSFTEKILFIILILLVFYHWTQLIL